MEIVSNIDISTMLAAFLKGFTNFTTWLFAITMLVYLIIKILVDLKNGFTVDPYVWAKPVILIIVLTNYSFLFKSVNIIFEKKPSEITEKINTELAKGVEKAELKAYIANLKKQEETELTSNIIAKGITQFCLTVLDFLNQSVKIILLALQKILLSILYIMGPFIIALDMVPGLGSSIKAWLFQVITISLWIPLLNIVSTVSLSVGKIAADNLVSANINAGASVANSVIFLVLSSVIAYLSYTRVPSIAASLFGSKGIAGTALGQRIIGDAGRTTHAKESKLGQSIKLSNHGLKKSLQSLSGLFKGSEHLKR
ncbi:MAG: hypothetical protein ACQPRJ_02320 [Solitalea-like symbiont of Acarus siro]